MLMILLFIQNMEWKNLAIEKAVIGDISINFYKVFIDKDKLTLTIPINQQSNLRPISSINQINKCISILKTKPKIKRTMWSRSSQEYEQKINSGKIYELAEVVKDLIKIQVLLQINLIVKDNFLKKLMTDYKVNLRLY